MLDPDTVPRYADLPHILVVDDDDRIRDLVSRYLTEHGFLAFTAADAAQARTLLKDCDFDALVLDVMMPGEDGVSLAEYLHRTSGIPVLLLTALGEVEDKIKGLQAGADDYLPKPFDPRELLLRLQSILRRAPKKEEKASEKIKIGPWVFDQVLGELSDEEDKKVRLTDVEATLLRALSARPGEVLSREALAEMVGTENPDAMNSRTIDVQITRLRRKMGEDSKAPRFLQTVRGKGYVLHSGGGD